MNKAYILMARRKLLHLDNVTPVKIKLNTTLTVMMAVRL